MQKTLFVCHGNICRSPMAEAMLKKLAEDKGLEAEYEIASAATSTEDYYYYNRIYVMDENNLRWLRYILPGEITTSPYYRDKVRLLMSLCGEERDVADPWYTGDFERTYRDIEKALGNLII